MSCISSKCSIRFSSNVVWLLAYQRNNKANGQKNLRCFPNHCIDEGHQRGFCGHSISVEYHFPVDPHIGFDLESFSLHAFAVFSEAGSPPFQVGSTIPAEYIHSEVRTTEHPLRNLIQGQLLRASFTDRHSQNAAVSFEFNRGLKGWHYGFVGSKLTRNLWHTFTAYVMEIQPGGQYYVVKAAVSSPQWQLYCRRRNKGPQALARRRISEEMQERFDQTLSIAKPLNCAPVSSTNNQFAAILHTSPQISLSPDTMLNFNLSRDIEQIRGVSMNGNPVLNPDSCVQHMSMVVPMNNNTGQRHGNPSHHGAIGQRSNDHVVMQRELTRGSSKRKSSSASSSSVGLHPAPMRQHSLFDMDILASESGTTTHSNAKPEPKQHQEQQSHWHPKLENSVANGRAAVTMQVSDLSGDAISSKASNVTPSNYNGRRNSKQRRQSMETTDPLTAMVEEAKQSTETRLHARVDPTKLSHDARKHAGKCVSMFVDLLKMIDLDSIKRESHAQLSSTVSCSKFAKYASNFLVYWDRWSEKHLFSQSEFMDVVTSSKVSKNEEQLVLFSASVLSNDTAIHKLEQFMVEECFNFGQTEPYKLTSILLEAVAECVNSGVHPPTCSSMYKLGSTSSNGTIVKTESEEGHGDPSNRSQRKTDSRNTVEQQQHSSNNHFSSTGLFGDSDCEHTHPEEKSNNNDPSPKPSLYEKSQTKQRGKMTPPAIPKPNPRLQRRYPSMNSNGSQESSSHFDELRESLNLGTIFAPPLQVEHKSAREPSKGTIYRNLFIKTKSGSAESIGSLNLSPMSRQRLIGGSYYNTSHGESSNEKNDIPDREDFSLDRSHSELMADLDQFLATTCTDNDVHIT